MGHQPLPFSTFGAATWLDVAHAPQVPLLTSYCNVAYPAMKTNKMYNFRTFLLRHYVLPKACKVGLKLPQVCEEDCGGARGLTAGTGLGSGTPELEAPADAPHQPPSRGEQAHLMRFLMMLREDPLYPDPK